MVLSRHPLSEVTQELVAAAMGKIPADTVIRGGKGQGSLHSQMLFKFSESFYASVKG